MRNIIIIIFFSLLHILNSQAQDTLNIQKKNGVYIEIYGNALLNSINYERIILFHKLKFAERIGFGIGRYYSNEEPNIPIESSVLIGMKNNFLETGPGISFLYQSYDNFVRTLIFYRIGYRHETLKNNWIFRIGYTPFIDISRVNTHNIYINYFGISIGKKI